MSAQLISVDPHKRDDAFYRYKMPEILIKIESSGNGVKTVFPNIRDVCDRLDRPEDVMIKYFGYVLGTQSTIIKKDDKFVVQGSHTQERLQEIVDTFITKFVLCQHCRNPETDPAVEGKNKITMTCRSCGKTTLFNSGERAHGTFLTYYSGKKAPPKTGVRGAPAVGTTGSPIAAVKEELPSATAAPAANASKLKASDAVAAAPQKANPIALLAEDLQSTEEIAVHVRKVHDLRTAYNIDDAFVVRLVFRATVDDALKKPNAPFIASLQKQVKLIERFADKPELIAIVFKEIEFHCYKYKQIDKFPMIVKMFFEHNIVKDADIEQWFSSVDAAIAKAAADKKEPIVPSAILKQYVERTKPLQEWIQA